MTAAVYQCICGKSFAGPGAKARAMAHALTPGNHIIKRVQ